MKTYECANCLVVVDEPFNEGLCDDCSCIINEEEELQDSYMDYLWDRD